MKLGKNDLCHCGSGIKYKKCCMRKDTRIVTTKELADKLDNNYSQYIDRWINSSDYYRHNGNYDWMAEQLDGYKINKLFDIGCGNGNGLLSLLKKFPQIQLVSIDENPLCLEEAKRRLESHGYSVELIERRQTKFIGEGYTYVYKPKLLTFRKQITLIESDFLNDEELIRYLKKIKFDAVTVWLIGTHFGVESNIHATKLGVNKESIYSTSLYRLTVQNRAYRVSDKILEPSGVLQIIDRGELFLSKFVEDDIRNSHSRQAAVTKLKVKSITQKEYQEAENGVEMIMSRNISGRIPDHNRIAFTSIISTFE